MILTDRVSNAYHRSVDSLKRIDYPTPKDLISFGTRFVAYSIVGATAGAISGEIIDRLPYFSEALPEAAQMIASLRGTEGTEVFEKFYGNLDKVGALAGLVMGAGLSKKTNGKQNKMDS